MTIPIVTPLALPASSSAITPITALSMPLHPLFVHGAVVFLPLAALTTLAFLFSRTWRWVLRWPTAGLAVLQLVFLMASRLTGDPLAHQERADGASAQALQLIENHDHMAGLLTIVDFPFVALTLLACWMLPGVSLAVDGRLGREARWPRFATPVIVLTTLLALAVVVLTVLTGDAGAKAVWTA